VNPHIAIECRIVYEMRIETEDNVRSQEFLMGSFVHVPRMNIDKNRPTNVRS
jgi:hypothetical protein